MNRILTFLFLLVCIFNLNAQNKDVVAQINASAIVIEDANPDTPLTKFSQNIPDDFKNARVFGFGEASHHGKEFFDLKAKYFKYLAEELGVRLFIMEESYQAEKGINEWISGGKGDKSTILKNFGQGIWRCQEMVKLLEWMRDYNVGKPYAEQIRFYGIDNQFGEELSKRLRSYVEKYDLSVDESLLLIADKCSEAPLTWRRDKKWAEENIPKLREIKDILEQNRDRLSSVNAWEYQDMLRSLYYLDQYTAFVAMPYSDTRDKDMYMNVLEVLRIEGENSKAFIWAHNEHINKKNLYATGMMSLGSRLKEDFKEKYYCVGFDFGKGKMKGYKFKDEEVVGIVYRILDEPYKKTFAETLYQAQPDIYFIDMNKIETNEDAGKFFSTKNRQLFLGGPGFDPENTVFLKRKYTEAYDGLIFVKEISPVTY